jgi:hypothetical protein
MAGDPGYISKIEVRRAGATVWTRYAVASWSFDDSAAASDISTTEGKPGNNDPAAVANASYGARLPGQSNARVTFQAPAYGLNGNEFAPPLQWHSGVFYGVRVYPEGIGAGLVMHEFPSLLCTRVGQNLGSPSNPIPSVLEMESDGAYFIGILQT